MSTHACDLLFEPAFEEIYPFVTAASVRIEIPEISEPLEGAMRPGHFICAVLQSDRSGNNVHKL